MTIHVFMFLTAVSVLRRHVGRFRLIILLFAASVCWPVPGHADEQQTQRVYRVAIDREYAPYEFVDMHGQAQGYTPSLLRALGEQAGVQFEFIAMNWPDALASLRAGRVDIVNMIVTPERAAEFQFSAPHSRIAQALFRNENRKNITSLDTLTGHVVALQEGDVSLDRLADRADFTRYIVDSKLDGLLHLNLDKVDAFFCAQQVCVRAISEYDFRNVELAAGGLFLQGYAFAARKENQPLIALLNQQLAHIHLSGQLQELEAQWLHGQLVQPSWLYRNRAVLSLLAATLLLGMVLLWNVSLRRLVNVRTKRLQESERHLVQSQRIAQIGSWTYDMDHHITWSDEMYRIFGVSPDTFTLNAESFISLIHPDDQAAMRSWVERCMSGQKPPALVFRRVWPDGTVHYIEGQGELLLNDDGTPGLMSGTGQDITGREETENRLRDSMRQLENKELAKTRFLAAAGHDLRQPLAAANMFLFALRSTSTSPQQEEIIRQMTHSMEAFKGLLDALLKVSRLDSGMIKPEYHTISVNEILIWLEQNFAVMAAEKRLGFRLYFSMKETLFVRSDVGLLKSVLSNLVANAIKFTARGAIMISARARGGDVLFQVWDTGAGIPEEHVEHVFDEFYQLGNPQRDRTSGLGLGLAIVKRTLTLLGGEVSCRSRPGRGTVFAFRLPQAESATVVASELPQAHGYSDSFAQGRTFVVLEDDHLVASATTTMLEGMGGRVICFSSAEQALLYADIGQADYYIVDFMLGGALDGIQFLIRLRQELTAPVKAVLVTGDTSGHFIHESAGFDWPVHYKPVDVQALFASLSAQGH